MGEGAMTIEAEPSLIHSYLSSSLVSCRVFDICLSRQIILWPYTSIFLSVCACMPFISSLSLSPSIYVINHWIFSTISNNSVKLCVSSSKYEDNFFCHWFLIMSSRVCECDTHTSRTKKNIIKCDRTQMREEEKSVNLIAFCAFWDFSMDFTYTIPMTITRNGNSYLKLLRNDVDFFEIEQNFFFDYFCVWPIVVVRVYSISNSLIYIFSLSCVSRDIRQGEILQPVPGVCALVWVRAFVSVCIPYVQYE